MKNFLLIILFSISQLSHAQELTVVKIDSIYRETLEQLSSFNKVVINVNHDNYDKDTITYYFDGQDLRYILKYTKYNTSEFAYDEWSWEEYLRIQNKLISKRYRGRTDVYDIMPKENATTRVGDSKSYFNLMGEAIQYYYTRGAEGTRLTADSLLQLQPWKPVAPNRLKYKNRYSKDDIPLIQILISEYPEYIYLIE